MCKNLRTFNQILCKVQLIQFERVKIESRKNLNSRLSYVSVEITLIHLSCLTNERDAIA